MEFEIGQIFEGEYPPEAAFWCNDCGDRYIKEVEATLDGVPRFQIVKVLDLTDEEIAASTPLRISLGGFFCACVLEVSSETQGMREVTCHTEI